MKARCRSDKNYGGRGIEVCAGWRDSYADFRDWALAHGYRNGLTIDRIRNDGNYDPLNCRWVTQREQTRNMRSNRVVSAFGETKTLADWTDDPRCVVGYKTLHSRIARDGWSLERAMTKPIR